MGRAAFGLKGDGVTQGHHHHHRYVAPRSGNGPLAVVILVFVLGIAGAIAWMMTRGDSSRGGGGEAASLPPTLPVASPPPVTPPATTAASTTKVAGVDQEYDARKDRLKVIARGIPLEDGVRETWTLDVSWTNPGKTPRRTSPIFWSVVHEGAEAVMKDQHRPRLVVDGKRLDVGAGDYGSQPKSDLVMEALRFSTNVDELLRIAAAGAVAVGTGDKTFDLSAEARERIRALASLVPSP